MKSDALLDYAEFQLSPKHSRCELFVSSGGTTEKLASGLFKPFIEHLKVAREQVAFSVGSIKLEVERSRNANRWFTKGTVERFLMFVSMPEILELANTLDAEMALLEAAQNFYSRGASSRSPSSQLSCAGGSGSGITALSDATKVFINFRKELLRAIDVRLSAVKQDLTTALYGAASEGFSKQTVSELQMFSNQFSAHRLNEACKKVLSLCEKRPELISVWRVGLDDHDIRCSYGSDMSIDEEPTTPEQQPSRSNVQGDGHSADANQTAETIQPSFYHQSQASFIAFSVHRSMNESESSDEKEKEGSVADSNPKGQHVRRLSVQDRRNLFKNKQKETSGSGDKPVVGKSVELKRLPSYVQEKAVLWSGASDMSVDLGGDKKDTESRLCNPSYVSASQTKCEDSKGLNFSYSTSSNKQDSEAVPCRVIDGDLKLQSLAKSSKNGEVISVGMQSTISSSKPTDDSKDVLSISATSTAESDIWRDQNSLKTKSKFSLNLAGSKKDQANPGAQFSPFLGTDTPNFGLANKGKPKGIHRGNEATKIRGHENYEGLQVTNKKQSKVSSSKDDDIRYNIDLPYAGKVGFFHQKDELEHRGLFSSESRVMGSQRTVVDSERSEISSSLRSRASSGSQFNGSKNNSLSSHPKWRSLVSSDEALKLGSSSGSTVKDSKYQKLNCERQVSNPEWFNRGQRYSNETDSVIGNHKTILSSKFAEQAPRVTDSFSLQPTSIGLRVQTKGNHDLNDELKVKANELEKRFPGDSNSTKRNRITDMPSESVATSSYKELVIDAAPVQLPTKHSLDDHAGGFSYAANFNSSTLLKLSANQTSGDVLSNHISQSSFTESSRGNHYETYVRKRNDKLKDDWTSRRVEKEAKLKAMQDSFERSAAEVKAKFSGSTDRMDPVSTAHQRVERLRSFNTRLNIMVEQKQLDFGQSDDDYLRNSEEMKRTFLKVQLLRSFFAVKVCHDPLQGPQQHPFQSLPTLPA